MYKLITQTRPFPFALIFVAYFMVWLPNEAVGLAMQGLEIGEWVKFLPETRNGQVALSRVWFYAPPLTLGAVLALYTANWPSRWQTWAVRMMAFVMAMLALPSVPDILQRGRSELFRVLLVFLVGVVCLLVGKLGRFERWGTMILAVVGGVMPFVAYLVFRPIIAQYLTFTPAIGIGVWLNLIGHLLLGVQAISDKSRQGAETRAGLFRPNSPTSNSTLNEN